MSPDAPKTAIVFMHSADGLLRTDDEANRLLLRTKVDLKAAVMLGESNSKTARERIMVMVDGCLNL